MRKIVEQVVSILVKVYQYLVGNEILLQELGLLCCVLPTVQYQHSLGRKTQYGVRINFAYLPHPQAIIKMPKQKKVPKPRSIMSTSALGFGKRSFNLKVSSIKWQRPGATGGDKVASARQVFLLPMCIPLNKVPQQTNCN